MSGETSYDTVPYPTGSYSQTHPDRLATVATLLGHQPAPPGRCRVLEIGCGNGGNLIPMAFAMPESTFTGIDLAATPIAQGEKLVEVGLKNITLLQQDLTTYAPEREAFDYVIAHGLYAWVAAPVQDRLLAVCRAALAPQGVAFRELQRAPGLPHPADVAGDDAVSHPGDPGARRAEGPGEGPADLPAARLAGEGRPPRLAGSRPRWC